MDELLAEFLIETTENLASADRALLRLERAPSDQPTVAVIFRAFHTMKGSCGFLPLPRLEKLAHAAEEVLGRVRDGQLRPDTILVSHLFATLDRIKLIVAGVTAMGREPEGDDSGLIADLGRLVGPATPAAAAQAGAAPPAASNEAGESLTAQTIRVNVGVLEGLMTLVSELVLTRNQLIQLARSHDDPRLTGALQRLSHLTSDLQEGVMKTRMQPIGQIRDTLLRLVRDLGLELGKRIELVMSGEDTELDRQVLELMRDPLIHMVRNSADHGLEDAAARRAAGKPETGTISVNAYHAAGHVVIELGDDGAGLATDRIRARALARGLAPASELASMTDAQIQRFIFRPGFTTAASVSTVSGRGVGMDVVKSNIERMGGSIDLHTTPGMGTAFTIKIPLTLAIISAFIVQAQGERFALPQSCVVELVRIATKDEAGADAGPGGPVEERVDGVPMLRLRDRLLPLIHLNEVLRLGSTHASTIEGSVVVVASIGTAFFGLVVDRVFDTEEIVVKPVAPLLRHITMFGGTTILGDGSVIMILEPHGLALAVGLGGAEQRSRQAPVSSMAERSGDLSSMLLFRPSEGGAIAAVPLGLVARIEEMAPEQIESSSGRPVTQYRGKLMPLVAIDPQHASSGRSVPVLVFADRRRVMGLIVHQIVDVVEEKLVVELSTTRPGLLGTAVIAGRVTNVIDVGYWLMQGWQDWFTQEPHKPTSRKRLLVVEDSAFFRQLLVPILSAAGYDVTAVDSAQRALDLRDVVGAEYDAIISDVEMPDMDGFDLARTLRGGGAWRDTPLLALTGRVTEADTARGRAAGFTDVLAKLDRDTLLAALQNCLGLREQEAA